MNTRLRRHVFLDVLALIVGIVCVWAPLDAHTLENSYANGAFAWCNRTLVPLANAVPFALGDLGVVALLGVSAIVWRRGWHARELARWQRVLLVGIDTLAIAAIVLASFEVSWGWNYHRAPVIARVAYDPARITPANVAQLTDRIVTILDRDVDAAHVRARAPQAEIRAELARDFAPVVARLGDHWPVVVTVPKITIADRIYAAAGVGGQYDPWFFETLLNSSFLPFEWPRALAHEWSHAAGFGDEGDANFIGTIACLRSSDPLIRYSGAYWAFAELPENERRRVRLRPEVIADFRAGTERFRAYYVPQFSLMSWSLYDRYLKANGVARGVVSYSAFVDELVGTSFDAAGLPLVRTASR